MPYSLVNMCQFWVLLWRQKQQVALKCWYPSNELYGLTSCNTLPSRSPEYFILHGHLQNQTHYIAINFCSIPSSVFSEKLNGVLNTYTTHLSIDYNHENNSNRFLLAVQETYRVSDRKHQLHKNKFLLKYNVPALVKPFCCRCGETGAVVGLCCWLPLSVAASTACASPLDDKLSVPKKEPGPVVPDVCEGDTKGPGATADCEGVTGVCWEVSAFGVPLVGDTTECTKPWPEALAAPEAEETHIIGNHGFLDH
jgi:hypothetical protein